MNSCSTFLESWLTTRKNLKCVQLWLGNNCWTDIFPIDIPFYRVKANLAPICGSLFTFVKHWHVLRPNFHLKEKASSRIVCFRCASQSHSSSLYGAIFCFRLYFNHCHCHCVQICASAYVWEYVQMCVKSYRSVFSTQICTTVQTLCGSLSRFTVTLLLAAALSATEI